MSLKDVLDQIGTDVVSAYQKLSVDVRKVKQAWIIVSSPQTRAVVLQLGRDGVKLVNDAGTAVSASGLNMQLDAAVVADIKQLIADAKAGDGVIQSDLLALGIKL